MTFYAYYLNPITLMMLSFNLPFFAKAQDKPEYRYLDNNNPSHENTSVYCPFEFIIDPMERLLLINFEGDPDVLYKGLEPQVFNDPVNGTGLLVLGWRIDGKVDVYHQPGFNPDPCKYDIAGKGLANLAERPMENAYFKVDDFGVQAYLEFEDVWGRQIEVNIRERNPKKRKPFGLLAPMGDAAEKLSAMPLVLLHDFYFVRKKHSEISIKVDDKPHIPDQLPLPLDGSKMYFTRYSPEPFIVTLNPAFNGMLPELVLEGNEKASLGETNYELIKNGAVQEIKSLSRGYKKHTISLSFDPAFPNIAALPEDAYAEGKFVIQGHPSTGSIKGYYQVNKSADDVRISMNPSKGWIHNEKKLTLKFMYAVVKVFRKWPASYQWNAFIKTDSSN